MPTHDSPPDAEPPPSQAERPSPPAEALGPGPELNGLLRLLALERLPRTGWILAGAPHPESVAAHTLGTAFVALALGPRVSPPIDVDRALALAVLHDAPEALMGDLPRAGARHLPEGAKKTAEAGAAAELLDPLSELARARFDEYTAQASREARFARLCDKLQLGIRLVDYTRSGWTRAGEFRDSLTSLDCSEFEPCARLRDEVAQVLGWNC